MNTRLCPTCQTVKGLAEFAPDPTKRSGRRFQCRPCDAARVRAAYARNGRRPGTNPDRDRRLPSYNWTRRKLREARGPASEQQCGCGSPADHWAYDHTDPRELVGDTGRGITATYSLDFTRYVPRCCSCHARDNAGRKVERLRGEVAALRVALWLAMLPAHRAQEARSIVAAPSGSPARPDITTSERGGQ